MGKKNMAECWLDIGMIPTSDNNMLMCLCVFRLIVIGYDKLCGHCSEQDVS